MRAAFAPVLLNVLLTTAGVGVLSALDVLELSFGSVVAGLGLAFLTGVASVGVLLVIVLVVGVPYTAATIALIAIAVGGGGAIASKGLPAGRGLRLRPSAKPNLVALLREHRFVVLFVIIFATYAIVGGLRAAVMPLSAWDAWAVWTQKAVLLTDFHHIPAAFFTDPAYAATHQNYPLLVPLLESMWFRFAGEINTQAVHLEFWLLLVGFIWATAYVLARRGVYVLLWGPLLLLVALAPGTSSQLLTGYADVPMALLAGLGMLLLGLWLNHPDPRHLALGVLFLSAAANTKNEGLAIAVIALVVAAAVTPDSRQRRQLVFGGAALGLAVLPWQLWSAIHGVASDPDLPLSKAFDLSYLLSRTGRIWQSLAATQTQLASQATWSYIVPVGLSAVIACVALRVARRPALFYLCTATLVLAVYLWVYWASPLNLSWYLATSNFRIIDVVIFIALSAILHLPTEVHKTLVELPPRAPHAVDAVNPVPDEATGTKPIGAI